MKPNLLLIIILLFFSSMFFIYEILGLKKEVRKLNKIVKHLLDKQNKKIN
tara:strand:- start:634 stop:783 length:150 start_codon:yes stop_codon:yes gene_type:complete